MPCRATPGDRTAIEAALPSPALEAVHQVAQAMAIPVDRWHTVDAIARPFVALAVLSEAERIQHAGASEKDSLVAAAIRLGVSPETVRSWSRRWFETAYTQGA